MFTEDEKKYILSLINIDCVSRRDQLADPEKITDSGNRFEALRKLEIGTACKVKVEQLA
jgi:hypothetical protein